MARAKDAMTQEDLEELNDRLSLLSPSHVEDFYREAYERCSLGCGSIPFPRAVQELVTAWKLLWKWK
jgi:hypothetical protein